MRIIVEKVSSYRRVRCTLLTVEVRQDVLRKAGMADIQQNGSRNGELPAEVVTVSKEEILAEIGSEAERRLGIKGGWQEFARLYYEGALPDSLAVNELAILLHGADEPRVS